jgi:YD repeat-containing protein
MDLDSEGLSGVLTEQAGAWFYKRNLGNVPLGVGDPSLPPASFAVLDTVQFAPLERVASRPSTASLAGGQQLMDLAGDGTKYLVELDRPLPGYYQRNEDNQWETFTPFESRPNIDWADPNLKWIDLNGDGHADLLISEHQVFVWYPSRDKAGFGEAERVSKPWDEEKGAALVFSDERQSIYLADMDGDGLVDIVRIRNGEVCYWSNQGYGQFGAKVTMDDAPWFDYPDLFDQKRVRLADIDGSGTTDVIYLGHDRISLYFNQSGNRWSQPHALNAFPHVDVLTDLTVADLLGNGTACLVWSSPLAKDSRQPMRYIDLMGGQKPHLMVRMQNNLGAETQVQYAASTRFYLQDRAAGTPWITKLPFPVHVVERVETLDHITGNRFVTSYRYHHGFYDGVEREFRGFGRVDQWDTETYSAFAAGGSSNALEESLHVPPIYTKTWFHTGAYLNGSKISRQFEHEYNAVDPQALLLPDTALPEGLTLQEEQEAMRSLKGKRLRQEIYAIDGSPQQAYPYSVTEQSYEIRKIQSIKNNRHGIFYSHDRESIDYHYERNPADPRTTHQMTLEVDEFGTPLKTVVIAYPRRIPAYPEQGKLLITDTENQVANKPNEADWYRVGVAVETRTYEITGVTPLTGNYFTPSEFYRRLPDNSIAGYCTAPEIPYEATAASNTPQKRLIERVRSLYRPNSQATTTNPTCLLLGEVESLALPCESFKLAFTAGLPALVYGSQISGSDLTALLQTAGYVQQGGDWWIPSGRQAFDSAQFYLPIQTQDPFGNLYTRTYDAYHLLVTQTLDPLSNQVQIRSNYRTMQPEEITDPNGNRSQVAFDALGMVVGTAVMGKVSETRGDNLTAFTADLPPATQEQHIETPLTDPQSILVNATTRLVYDLERYRRTRQVLPDGSETGQPGVVYTLAREIHAADLAPGETTRIQHSFLYSDGFGREIQTKVQAEPGLAPGRNLDGSLKRDGAGKLILEDTNPRWVGTGRTVFNNKDKPVKKYEPFFSATHRYEREADLVEWGVTPPSCITIHCNG